MADSCVRGCLSWRRHLPDCPAEDRTAGYWEPWRDRYRDDMITWMSDPDIRASDGPEGAWFTGLARAVHVGQYGGLEIWHPCSGCKPRDAAYGAYCGQCHTRLHAWLNGHTRDRAWHPAEASIAWAYTWLTADLQPSQAPAGPDKVTQGKKNPPAPINIHIHDLRQELATTIGQWLRAVTSAFDLRGPAWWAHRVNTRLDTPESWRSWMPHTAGEMGDAQRWLSGWLPRIEEHPDVAQVIYAEADAIMVRVSSIAPWRARPQRAPGKPCPACGRAALVQHDGDEYLACRRCGETVPVERGDVWAGLAAGERMAS